MLMKPTQKQIDFGYFANHRWNFKEGAVRSGKTYLDLTVMLPYRILNADTSGERQIFIMGHTRETIESNILAPMRNMFGEEAIGHMNSNTGKVQILGKTVRCIGADKVTAVNRIHGATVSYCYGDEVTTWHPAVFDEIKARLSASGAMFDGTCNPEGPDHWLLEFLNSDADIYRQKYLLSDNKENLDPEYYENIQKEYAGTVYYDRYILGEWALAEGRVYAGYDPMRDSIAEIEEPLTGRRVVSCDYGTENPCVFILWEEGISGTWYASDGWGYDGRKTKRPLTDSMYVEHFIGFLNGRKINSIVVDPSAASFIAALKVAGFTVIRAKNDVRPGIQLTADCLVNGRIKILKGMSGLLTEIGGYCWDEKSVKAGEEKPIKVNDHWCDAMRYFVYTMLRERFSGVYAE